MREALFMSVADRLKAFEKMLLQVQESYDTTVEKMKQLRAEGKEKSVTYRQLMGNKLQYQNMLSLYRIHGLLESVENKSSQDDQVECKV